MSLSALGTARPRPLPSDQAAPVRLPPSPATRTVSPEVARLLRRLPVLQLELTTIFYPSVLETIARAWAEPAVLRATLDRLIFDARGGRAGFPPEVVLELAELRTHYDLRVVAPRPIEGR
jgi:hypothetical protein